MVRRFVVQVRSLGGFSVADYFSRVFALHVQWFVGFLLPLLHGFPSWRSGFLLFLAFHPMLWFLRLALLLWEAFLPLTALLFLLGLHESVHIGPLILSLALEFTFVLLICCLVN